MEKEKVVKAADFIATRFSHTLFAVNYKKQSQYENEDWYIEQLKNDLEECIIGEFLYINTGDCTSAIKMVGNILRIIDEYFTKVSTQSSNDYNLVKERDNALLSCLYNKDENGNYPENCGLLELILSMLNKYEFVTYGFSITASSLQLTEFGKVVKDILLDTEE